jgi:mRNA-degrading endonuclease RelE of RelBE toxin-antitoxin system
MAFRIVYNPEADLDIDWLPRNEQVLLRAVVRRLLSQEPTVPSHRRKPLAPNPLGAEWEVRQGNLRALYTVDESAGTVRILGAGTKRGNDLYIRGQRVDMRAQT